MSEPTREDDLAHKLYLSLKMMPCTCRRDYDMNILEQCRRCLTLEEYEIDTAAQGLTP